MGLTEQQLTDYYQKSGFVLLKGLFSLELTVWIKEWKGSKPSISLGARNILLYWDQQQQTNRYFPVVAGVAE